MKTSHFTMEKPIFVLKILKWQGQWQGQRHWHWQWHWHKVCYQWYYQEYKGGRRPPWFKVGHLQPIYLYILGCSLGELPLFSLNSGLTNFVRQRTWKTEIVHISRDRIWNKSGHKQYMYLLYILVFRALVQVCPDGAPVIPLRHWHWHWY